MNRPRRKRGGAYNFPALRRREIERHARDVGAAYTEDFWRWIVGWRWHNEQNSRDPAGALILAAKRMGGSLTEAGAERILETADTLPRCCTADKLGKFLGVTYAQRQRLAITTIGSIDVNKRSRALLRKRKNRLHNERKRRAQGIRPRAVYKENSLMHIKPWEAEGISRRTWYRRKRGTGPSPPIPPLKTAAQMAQVRQQPSYLSLLTHLCHRRESKGAAEGALALRTRRKRLHLLRWCWRTEFISLGAGSRRGRGCVAVATMAGCTRRRAKRRRRRPTADPPRVPSWASRPTIRNLATTDAPHAPRLMRLARPLRRSSQTLCPPRPTRLRRRLQPPQIIISIARWGGQAQGCGWTSTQQAALIWQIRGREVTALSPNQATIGNKVIYRFQL